MDDLKNKIDDSKKFIEFLDALTKPEYKFVAGLLCSVGIILLWDATTPAPGLYAPMVHILGLLFATIGGVALVLGFGYYAISICHEKRIRKHAEEKDAEVAAAKAKKEEEDRILAVKQMDYKAKKRLFAVYESGFIENSVSPFDLSRELGRCLTHETIGENKYRWTVVDSWARFISTHESLFECVKNIEPEADSSRE